MTSTGIFANRDDREVFFFNPKVTVASGGNLPEKYRNVKIMVSRIEQDLKKVLSEGEETEFYVEAPFIGMHGSGLELAGLSFMLIDRILKLNKTVLFRGGKLFMLSASLVGGKDRKAKRDRKDRKPFANKAFWDWTSTITDLKAFGTETLSKAKDDVSTAFLFWYFCFGPGLEEKAKNRPTYQEVPQDYFESIFTGDDDGV